MIDRNARDISQIYTNNIPPTTQNPLVSATTTKTNQNTEKSVCIQNEGKIKAEKMRSGRARFTYRNRRWSDIGGATPMTSARCGHRHCGGCRHRRDRRGPGHFWPSTSSVIRATSIVARANGFWSKIFSACWRPECVCFVYVVNLKTNNNWVLRGLRDIAVYLHANVYTLCV